VNHYAIAVVGGVFVALMLGFVWYSPSAFGETWLEAVGRRPEDLRAALRPMLGSVGALALSSAALAGAIELADVRGVEAGALAGAIAGVLVAGAMLSDYLFCGWPLRVCAIQAGYRAIYLVLMGVALAART
jgi:hypothetical protein